MPQQQERNLFTAPTAKPLPGRWWPPDRKVWAGGLGGIIAYTIIGVVHWKTGFDLNALAFFVPGLDLQNALAIVVAGIIAHLTPPSLHDVVDKVNNVVVAVANADPDNPTTAMVVSDVASEQAAARSVDAGLIPPDIVAKRNDT